MLGTTSQGRTKLEAAVAAAGELSSMLALASSPGDPFDRVAIVGFNNSAWTEIALSSNRQDVEDAIRRLTTRVAEGTRLDLAAREGVRAMSSGRSEQDVSRSAALVLLTDGLPNRVPTPQAGGSQEETVLSEIQHAKDEHWDVYTIGLGEDGAADPSKRINARLLREMASYSDWYYETPDAEELQRLFQAIGRKIACP
jgi:Mg-chelatase subunit ChlD